MTLQEAAQSLSHWAFCDVGGQIKPRALRETLELDVATGATVPTEDECRVLVCGDDETGEVPEALHKRYAATNALLEQELT